MRQLVLIANDDLIAGILNRNGLKTGNGNRWTRERVTSMRSNYRIPVFKPAEDGMEPWLNLSSHQCPRYAVVAALLSLLFFDEDQADWNLDGAFPIHIGVPHLVHS